MLRSNLNIKKVHSNKYGKKKYSCYSKLIKILGEGLITTIVVLKLLRLKNKKHA